MALTESKMMELGSQAPDFSLISTEEENISLKDFDKAEVLVVAFICNHCPYVIHIAPALAALAKTYASDRIAFVAINSNDAEAYPDDSFDNMKLEKALRGYNFPYLYDEDQTVAQAYNAACTPDIYVFDQERKLAYRGQFDDSRPHRIASGQYDDRNGAASGSDLEQAIVSLLNGQSPSSDQVPSMGCNIKWKPGNEPQ